MWLQKCFRLSHTASCSSLLFYFEEKQIITFATDQTGLDRIEVQLDTHTPMHALFVMRHKLLYYLP